MKSAAIVQPGLPPSTPGLYTHAMNRIPAFASVLLALLVLCGVNQAAGQPDPTATLGTFAGLATNGPAVHRLYLSATRIIPGPEITFRPPATNLPLELRRGFMIFRAAANVTVQVQTNKVLDHLLPDSLNYVVWTNFIAHTNGRNTSVWSVRSKPQGWPERPPLVQWNTSSLIWGMKAFTALSPCWELEGSPGQAPITALTRRHGYTRGHSMGGDRVGALYAGKRVWFVTSQNQVIQMTVKREIVRTVETSKRDYTIVLFDSDLPETIQPMRVVSPHEVFDVPRSKYIHLMTGEPCPFFKTEQTGNVSADVPGFLVDTFKGGDSGSPNMLPLPGELAFSSGRSTAGASPEMQADMDTLCRLEGLNPAKYQLQWVDLSAYPTYSSY